MHIYLREGGKTMKSITSNFKNFHIKHISLDLKNLFLKILLGIFCYVLLTHSDIFRQGIRYGINICFDTLVPSLFPFMIIASFVANSGIFEKPNKIVSKITETLFYLPGYTYPAIILSFIGGYPVGAKAVKTLYEERKINDEQLNRMMCFCVNSGPAFTVSMLGGVLLNNKTIGITIFGVQVALGILIGIVLGINARISQKRFYFLNPTKNTEKIKIREALINSVTSGCESIIQMCAVVVIFTAFIGMLKSFGFFDFIPYSLTAYMPKSVSKTILISILEVTYGCIYAAKNMVPYWILAFAVGHGGICTHLQISAILKGTNFKYSKFCIFRMINAILSALVFCLISRFLPIVSPVFSNIGNTQPIITPCSTPMGSIALIILCFYFLADIKLNTAFKK